MQKRLPWAILALHFCFLLQGQNPSVSIEIDPSPFFLKGYSISAKLAPARFPRSSIMLSVFSADFPDRMMRQENREAGWTQMHFKASGALFTDFYFKRTRKGFHVGPSVFWYRKTVKWSTTDQRVQFNSLYPNIRAGFVWYPFKKIPFYFDPWMNIGTETIAGEKPQINGVLFQPNRFYYILAIHLGYTLI